MAGIYIHIPFCKQACHYCDFHFSTSLKTKEEFLLALQREIGSRTNEISDQKIETIYLGGGTPSILTADEVKMIIEWIYNQFNVVNEPEITLEANPDDLTKSKVREWRTTAINRFSIGVQSFSNADLNYLNRAHSADEADAGIKAIQDAGIENITIDFIYGIPGSTELVWDSNLNKAIELGIPHISAYALTLENDTPLFHLIKRKKLSGLDDDLLADQYHQMLRVLRNAGFEQYEISNFSQPGMRSRHNSSYWAGKPYLGFGPSAHSYDGERIRRWNISNNIKYIRGILEKGGCFESEVISDTDKMNEVLLTRLRLLEGLGLNDFENRFGTDFKNQLIHSISFISKKYYEIENDHILLTDEGKLISDRLISNLFFSK